MSKEKLTNIISLKSRALQQAAVIYLHFKMSIIQNTAERNL